MEQMNVVQILAAALGVNPPEHITTKEAFLEWHKNYQATTSQPVVIGEDISKIFVSQETGKLVRQMKRDRENLLASANEYMTSSHKYLESAHEKHLDILKVLGRSTTDVAEELNKILVDGFYQFKDYDKDLNAVSFTTSTVRIFLGDNGIGREVSLGRFIVRLFPNKILVFPYESNTFVSGYNHPHVSTTGNPCWGTAHQIYVEGMALHKYSKVMNALRCILTQYNADSPYVEGYRFLLKQGVLDLEEYSYTYQPNEDYTFDGYLLESELPKDIDRNTVYDREETEDGDSLYSFTVYNKFYTELDYFDDSTNYYRTTNKEYKEW